MKSEPPPVFLYSMISVERTRLRHLFEMGPLRSLLENPGQLRYAGWDLTTQGQARIIKGQYLELKSAERKRLQLYEDGSFFVKVSADYDFLSWGMSEHNFRNTPRLNTLALIEFSLNFCLLCGELVRYLDPAPLQIDLNVEIRNAFIGDAKLRLIPHPVSSYGFGYEGWQPAPESSAKRQIRVAVEQLKGRPEVVAYLLVRQIFLWFGVMENMIPYSSADGDVKFIDAAKITNSRSQ